MPGTSRRIVHTSPVFRGLYAALITPGALSCRRTIQVAGSPVPPKGRAARQRGNGSFGCRLRNNVFINDISSSIEVGSTGIYRFDAARNVVNQISHGGMPGQRKRLALSLPETQAQTGITRARLAAEVVRASEEPWVLVEGGFWKLNPNRPDFRPKPGSRLLLGQGDAREMPARDLLGKKRTSPDLGAFAAGLDQDTEQVETQRNNGNFTGRLGTGRP